MHRRVATLVLAIAVAVPVVALDEMILMPDSTTKNIQIFRPFDGSYVGVFGTVPQVYGTSSTPINAVLGPDGNVYVSDQVQDAVFKFASNGAYLGVFADNSDGLDNVRGIAWSRDELFVTMDPSGTANDAIARFALDGTRLTDFAVGTTAFDIHFLPDNTALVADLAGTDGIRHYDTAGNLISTILAVNFPEQINSDPVAPGAFLNAGFSDNTIRDFDLNGTVYSSFSFSGGRGVLRLGNGNILATKSDGVWVMDPTTGVLLSQSLAGSGRFLELVPEPTSLVLLALGLVLRRR